MKKIYLIRIHGRNICAYESGARAITELQVLRKETGINDYKLDTMPYETL